MRRRNIRQRAKHNIVLVHSYHDKLKEPSSNYSQCALVAPVHLANWCVQSRVKVRTLKMAFDSISLLTHEKKTYEVL